MFTWRYTSTPSLPGNPGPTGEYERPPPYYYPGTFPICPGTLLNEQYYNQILNYLFRSTGSEVEKESRVKYLEILEDYSPGRFRCFRRSSVHPENLHLTSSSRHDSSMTYATSLKGGPMYNDFISWLEPWLNHKLLILAHRSKYHDTFWGISHLLFFLVVYFIDLNCMFTM